MDERTLRHGSIFTLETDLGAVDLLAEVAGVGGFAEAKEQSDVHEIFGVAVAVLNLKALIRAKRAAGRPKDLAVLKELESLLEAEDG
jgi:hypothetical protein